jgi:hypothetical protein
MLPLDYLLRLSQCTLPAIVDQAEEVRSISILKATGMVKAEIAPAQTDGGAYTRALVAIVMCITGEGYAEIARIFH